MSRQFNNPKKDQQQQQKSEQQQQQKVAQASPTQIADPAVTAAHEALCTALGLPANTTLQELQRHLDAQIPLLQQQLAEEVERTNLAKSL